MIDPPMIIWFIYRPKGKNFQRSINDVRWLSFEECARNNVPICCVARIETLGM
jgi:hypothetical protein